MARRKNQVKDERSLVNLVADYIEGAINAEDGDVTIVRQTMFERYYGEPFGNERQGFSKYVSREVFKAVEWALPALLRVFMSGVRPVMFRATGPNDVEQAKLETDVVSYWFFEGSGSPESSGFVTLYQWLKDILMFPNGYVAVSVHEEEEEVISRYPQLSNRSLRALRFKYPDARITKEETYGEGQFKVHDVAVSSVQTKRWVDVSPIPPDQCLIEHGHNKLDVDSARFSCIRVKYTREELRGMGYSDDDLDDAGSSDEDLSWASENVIRHFYVDELPESKGTDSSGDSEEFWYHKIFIRTDYNGDGVPELRRVIMIGSKIFENEETDYVEIVAATALLMSHKHIGLSYAETVADLQELMSTLIRQMLDNIYKQNVRRLFVNEQALLSDNQTMDQLLDSMSEHVLVRGAPAEAIMPEQIPAIVGDIATVIEQFKEEPQLRTGVAPQLTLDPSVLEKSTLGAFLGALDQASQRLELLARLFAETGFKTVMQKIHFCLRNYFTDPQEVEIRGKWAEVNTKEWKKRANMTVNVGLGNNNKQTMVTLLTTMLQIQKEAIPEGLASAANVYNTLERLIDEVNLGHTGTYFVDPREPGWKAPEKPPEPQMILAQAQAQSLQADAKRKDQELNWKINKEKEDQQIEITKLMQALEKLQHSYSELQSKLALNAAQITELNSKAAKESMQPAPDSSSDEWNLAGQRLSEKGESSSASINGSKHETITPQAGGQSSAARQPIIPSGANGGESTPESPTDVGSATDTGSIAPGAASSPDSGQSINPASP